MLASSPFSGLLHHASLWLQAYALVLALMAAGALLERRWPATLLQSRSGQRLNMAYAGLYLALVEGVKPLTAAASVAIVNALGGGMVVLVSRGWGALASFDSSKPRKTKKIYGSTGNSFVAAVEFGPTIHAKAIMSGGESGDPSSPHFTDQALMFSLGHFRDVLFYPEEVRAHAERSYQP